MFDFIAEPFGWLLRQIYDILGSYGISIIVFTFLSKLVILPFQMKSKKSMIGMQRVQPKMKELEKKYKDDKQKYALAVQQLYKEEGVSMLGGCLPILLTLPIMFALYSVIREPLTYMFGMNGTDIANAFAARPELQTTWDVIKQTHMSSPQIEAARMLELVDFSFFGMKDFFAHQPSFGQLNIYWSIPILSGLSSYFMSWVSKKYQPKPADGQPNPGGMMTTLMPLMSVWIAFIVPAGLGFYWIINNLLSAAQEPILQWYYTVYKPKKAATAGGKK